MDRWGEGGAGGQDRKGQDHPMMPKVKNLKSELGELPGFLIFPAKAKAEKSLPTLYNFLHILEAHMSGQNLGTVVTRHMFYMFLIFGFYLLFISVYILYYYGFMMESLYKIIYKLFYKFIICFYCIFETGLL